MNVWYNLSNVAPHIRGVGHTPGAARWPRLLLSTALSLAVMAQAGNARVAQAAGVNPLPAVAKALASVRSYQVTITSSFSGFPRSPRRGTPTPGGGSRPTPTPGQRRGRGFGRGPGTQTIVAVRKGNAFEDYIVSKSTGASGQSFTRETVVYGSKVCMRNNGKGAYSCQTMQQQFNFDPTTAFEQGAGSAVFTPKGTAKIQGQSCNAYSYANKFQNGSASGLVYISRSTNLPCKQIATTTRRGFSGTGTFTQHQTIYWSHFNDRSLKVPAIPSS